MRIFGLLKSTSVPFPKNIRGLTSLRFFAALAIVVFHFIYEVDTLREAFWGRLYLGVDFFFILSGFILTHSYIQPIEKGSFSAKNFYIKRLARIYPVHIVTLMGSALTTLTTIYVLKGYYFDPGDSVKCFFYSLVLLQAWGMYPHLCFDDPSWSISAEWFAYLLFPLLAGWAVKKSPWTVISLSSLGFLILFVLFTFLGKQLTELTTLGFARITPEFALGMGLYQLGRKYTLKVSAKAFLVILIAGIVACLSLNINDAVIVFLLGGIIFTVADMARKEIKTFLDQDIMVYWGEASYALYMLHYIIWESFPVIVLMRKFDGSKMFDIWFFASWPVALFLSLLLSHFTYAYFERPVRFWICRKFIRK
ncbi:MAG: acyltransferase [Alphaproteobacteria bacterium]|nr:acyltransferase [Alphaproteobacteria bacterium]